MTKRKVLRVLVGEAYDKDSGKNLPVYKSYWLQEDGSYSRNEKIWVSEVEVPDKKPSMKQNKIEA